MSHEIRVYRRERIRQRAAPEIRVRGRAKDEYLGSGPWKIRQFIAHRRIPFVQDGDGAFWLDIHDLHCFIERNKRVV